ncbi:MAG: sugar phosphate isomerase/epimerase [Treponema sp.]|nr:sugar phosphate isomerase/epimerase [Treponema sp.]
MSKPRIAVQLFSVRHELEKDIPGTLQAVRDIGYEGAEFFGPYIKPDVLVKALKKSKLKIVGWHTPLANIMPGLIEAAIAYNKLIGNTSMVVPALPAEYTANRAGWLKAAEILQTASKRLAEEGMSTGYHNHNTEFKNVEGQTPWDIIAGATDKNVVLQIDTGNCMNGKGDPLALLRKYPGRSKTIHLKPFSKAKEFATMIGSDDTDWQALKKIGEGESGAEWYIVEWECESFHKPLEGIQLCFKALKDLGF